MKQLSKENFKQPPYLFNRHLETIYPAFFRTVDHEYDNRVRITTPDDDFIDIDINAGGASKTAIICHGLEGNSQKPYIKGVAKSLSSIGFNCLSWNFRSCSGEPNNHPYSYHSGATGDLDLIIDFSRSKFPDSSIYLVGFSLGGNLVLKYLGDKAINTGADIKKAVAISSPIDLHSACLEISKSNNYIYTLRFLRKLKKKVKIKSRIFPNDVSLDALKSIKNLEDFDNFYTAPLHGFKDAMDYYTQCSSLPHLANISIPTLLLNARNDHFLSEKCFPEFSDFNNKNLSFLYPQHGGHVGFKMHYPEKGYFSDYIIKKFFSQTE